MPADQEYPFPMFFFAQAKTDQQEEYPTDRGDEKKV